MDETEMAPNMEEPHEHHQQATIPADPQRVYQVLADAEALSALPGEGRTARWQGPKRGVRRLDGRRDRAARSSWSLASGSCRRGGSSVGAGRALLVTFTLTAVDGGTRLTIDQHGEPNNWHDHLAANWPTFYLTR